MKRGFLLKSSNDNNTNSTESRQLKPYQNSHENLELINHATQLNFKPAENLRTILPKLPNVDLRDIDIQASIYAIVPREKELSYQAFFFIADCPNVDLYYQENSTLVIIKSLLGNFNEDLRQQLKNLLHIKENSQLQRQAITDTLSRLMNAEDEISKKSGNEFNKYVITRTFRVLHLLQVATLLKLPNYFIEIGSEVIKCAIPEMLTLALINNIDISDIDKMSIREQYETLNYRLNESMGESAFVNEGISKNEGDWKDMLMLSLNKHAEYIGWKCLDADCTFCNESSLEIREKVFSEYLDSAKYFLKIVRDRFLMLKQLCNFKASTYYLYQIFNLDILVNVILKNPLDPDSKMLTEERNILIYIDRYSKGGQFLNTNIMLAHIAMARIGLHREDDNLVDQHFNQFKEMYMQSQANHAGYLHSFILVKVSEIIKRICTYYESKEDFQKAFQTLAALNLIANAAYQRLVQFQKSLRDSNLDEFVRVNPNNPLTIELMETRSTSVPYQFFEGKKNSISQFCREKLNEFLPKVKAQRAREENVSLGQEDRIIENTKETTNISSQSEEPPILEENPIMEKPKQEKILTTSKAEDNKSIRYSESYFLWSSLNKKLNLEARIDIQSCCSLTQEELEAALRILQSGRITGAIGNGIKLVTEEEQKKHNLQDYIYKIKHVDLNFRIYAKYYKMDDRKELIFDYVIRGHKNHTKNTPGNIAVKTMLQAHARWLT